jgi:hypothetical protein
MAISVVQRNKAGNPATTSTVPVAFAANTAAGNALIAIAATDGALTTLSAISDTQAKTWNLVSSFALGSFAYKAWIAYGSTAAADTITVTSGFNDVNVYIFEVTGLASSSAFDKSASAQQSSATALSSGTTATLTNPNNLVIGITSNTPSPGLAPTVGAGFSNLQTLTTQFHGGGSEEQIVASTAGVAATFGLATNSGSESTIAYVFSDTVIAVAATTPKTLMTMGIGV